MVVLVKLILAVGKGFTIICCVAVAVPQAAATVKIYIPAVLTLMVEVVAPVDQLFPAAALELRITELPWQKVVGPEAVMAAVTEGVTAMLCVAEADAQALDTVSV